MSAFFDIAPAPGNPRNSEGAFLPLGDGRVLFVYSAFRGDSARDHMPADLTAVVSRDGGRTFGPPRVVVSAAEHGAMNVMSVSLLRMADGSVGLFYLVRKSFSDMRPVLRRSRDGGETFGPAVLCAPRAGYFVVNNDRALRLSSGRIALPAAEHATTFDAQGNAHISPAWATCFYSDDDGETWRETDAPLAPPGARTRSGLQEPGLVELSGGLLYGWARTDLGVQYEFFSPDGARRFTAPEPSPFTSPLAPLSMKRLSDGRLLALWCPVPQYQTRPADPLTLGRTPLVYAFSADDARTWTPPATLEDDPRSGYCYTAICELPEERALLLSYCAGDSSRGELCLNRTRIRRVSLEELG